MKYSIFAIFFLFAGNASADLLLGTFEGKTPAGEDCKIQVNTKYYFPDQKHPLNERVSVSVYIDENGELSPTNLNWDLAHPPAVDLKAGEVNYDHNVFQQIIAVEGQKASEAVIMRIDHDVDPHPALEYTYIRHHHVTEAKTKIACLNLKKTNQ